MSKTFLIIASVLGALSVALGAFAAHGLKKIVPADTVATFETGVRYQFYHTFALLVTALLLQRMQGQSLVWAGYCFIIGIILLDLAMQGIHVSNQSRVYTLLPEARNRLNTVYMTVSFTGTSLGSAIGLFVWDRGGWKAVCITGMIISILCFAFYAVTYKKTSPARLA